MADQGVSNQRRKELSQMDPFQESMNKTLAYASGHKKQLGMTLGAVVVVMILISATMYSFKQSEITASTLVARASDTYSKAFSKDQDPKAAYEAAKGDYEKILDEYANTSAGKTALVSYARICYDAGVLDKAETYYKRALSELDSQTEMKNLLLAALGNISRMNNQPEQAKSYFLKIETGASPLLKDEARFSLAQIYEAENNTAESRKMYDKIVGENENSMYRPIALARIGQME